MRVSHRIDIRTHGNARRLANIHSPPATQPIPTVEELIPTESIPADEPAPPETPPTQEGPTIPDRSLGSGPWLLIEAEGGMWAVNPDGSGLTHLTDEVPIITQDMGESIRRVQSTTSGVKVAVRQLPDMIPY